MTQTIPAFVTPAAGAHATAAKPCASETEPLDNDETVSVTFYIPGGLRNRSRAAYRATSLLECDTSWSDLVRKALTAEVERREREHNDGVAYVGDGIPLRAGRPLTWP